MGTDIVDPSACRQSERLADAGRGARKSSWATVCGSVSGRPHLVEERSRCPVWGSPGVYLCGAATHPAASVIALNGRNAAMAVLEDARVLT